MIPLLAQPPARFTFVVGKGGVGKSTSAAALALAWSEARPVRLVSTDPAHSLADVFAAPLPVGAAASACTPTLLVEQLDAEALATAWLARARPALAELLEAGSYLGTGDIHRLTSLRLPGTGEVMAALRLVELADGAESVVVDTAPTGHTLRLLDAHLVLDTWCELLRALAAKRAAVASALAGVVPRTGADRFREELATQRSRFQRDVLESAACVVVTRNGEVVEAETARLQQELALRALPVAAVLAVPGAGPPVALADALPVPCLPQPVRGCVALRAWAEGLGTTAPIPGPGALAARTGSRGSGGRWLECRTERLLLFAGKGGVGKSTCAAAAALRLAETRSVLLLGTDPAGSLSDLLERPIGRAASPVLPGLRVAQLDAAAALAEWQGEVPAEAEALLARVGLGGDPALDRGVLAALWQVQPPGLDELVALTQLLELADATETVVLDPSPTGHFLALLALPEVALEWTRTFLRLLLEYRLAGELDALTRRVLAFARQLQSLQGRLADAGRTGTVLVTAAEPVIEAESARLATQLARADVPVAAVLTNFHAGRPATVGSAAVRLSAPACWPPPRGLAGLRQFTEHWELE